MRPRSTDHQRTDVETARNRRRNLILGWLIVCLTIGLPLLEGIAHRDPAYHPHVVWESWPAFHVWYSIGATLLLVLASRAWLMLVGAVADTTDETPSRDTRKGGQDGR